MAEFGPWALGPTLTLAPASVPAPCLAVALIEERRREERLEKREKLNDEWRAVCLKRNLCSLGLKCTLF